MCTGARGRPAARERQTGRGLICAFKGFPVGRGPLQGQGPHVTFPVDKTTAALIAASDTCTLLQEQINKLGEET